MSPSVSIDRYSTVADFELVVGKSSHSVTQVSAEFIILKHAADIPPCEADLYIRVEGEAELHRRIRLPQGASVDSPRVMIKRELPKTS